MKAPGRGLERGWEQYIWRNLFRLNYTFSGMALLYLGLPGRSRSTAWKAVVQCAATLISTIFVVEPLFQAGTFRQI